MYSVRMRAESNRKHISGAERIVEDENIPAAVSALAERALSHERGKPDLINISVEALGTPIKSVTSLPLILTRVEDAKEGKALARKLLLYLKIPFLCIERALALLEGGPADGENMRGAIIMNMLGERLEPDKRRGVRASRMDIGREASEDLEHTIAEAGLMAYYTYISEALVLATKVSCVEGTIAELCWSDDPSYTVGYVASRELGYVRIPHLKQEGDRHGGRVFFVSSIDLQNYIHDMENAPVLVDKFGGLKEISMDRIQGEYMEDK